VHLALNFYFALTLDLVVAGLKFKKNMLGSHCQHCLEKKLYVVDNCSERME
jgi:hypothetical protein